MNCTRLECSLAFKRQGRSALSHNKNHRIFLCLLAITQCCGFLWKQNKKACYFEGRCLKMLALGLWNIRAEILVTLVTATIIISPEKKVIIPNNLNKETKYPSKRKFCYVSLAPAPQILLWVWQLLSWQKQNTNLNSRIHLKAQIVAVWNERSS